LLNVVDSIYQQSVKPHSITILDDGSCPKLNIPSSSSKFKIYNNISNRGRGFIRRLAIDKADTDFIFFCDATNIVPSDFIKSAILHFSDPKVAAVSGKIANEFNTCSIAINWRGRHLFKQDHDFGKISHETGSLTTYGTIFRRSAVLDVGNFNPSLRHSEDKDLGKRLLNSGYKIIGDPNLVVYSIKKDTIFSVLERYWRWYGGEDENMSLCDYLNAIKASFKPMIQQDLNAKDWRAALVSFLCPHYGYMRYHYRKITGNLQKIV
jgi:cellulose synthase/poly-beta-1,6-N-acetylglucosamine synthase-like glycosyltransferase